MKKMTASGVLVLGAATFALLLRAAPAGASATTAASLFEKMKAALEPSRSSTRTMKFTLHSAAFGENTQVTARQAQKSFPEGARSVTVVTAPESLKGITLLVVSDKAKPNTEYVYFPALRRVRHIVGPGRFEPFLGSDFTYADLGLVDPHDRGLAAKGMQAHDGAKAYELEEKPRTTTYYSRIVDWIAPDTKLPIERDHYDPANVLWRKEVFDDVEKIDGSATPMHVRIDDLESHDWSEYKLADVHYDVSLSDDLFDPARLPEVAQKSDWSAP
jgi:hypothetical protein